ncbi:MAG: sugar transferase, partial [Candidatus Methylomirabilales bacterium]
LKEKAQVLKRIMFATELSATVLAFVLAYHVRQSVADGSLASLLPFSDYQVLLVPLVVIWSLLLHWMDAYRGFRTVRTIHVIAPVIKVVAVGTILLSFSLFLFKFHRISRLVIFLFALCDLVVLCGIRLGVLTFLRRIRRRGYNARNLLVVGTGRRAQEFAELIHSHPEWGLRVQGYLDRDRSRLGHPLNGRKVIGTLADMPQILDRHVIDEVVFVVPRSWLNDIEQSIRLCEERGVKASIAVDLYNPEVARPLLSELEGIPLLTYSTTPFPEGKLAVKRAFDIMGSIVLLLLTAPLWILIGAAIKLTSAGPVFFRQIRVGLHGRPFTFLKFRSMVADAEERLDEVAHLNEMSGPAFKAKHDPRVTPVGRLLRKTSLDELPQLINVLRGEMSLVGPRPPLPSEVVTYEPWQRRRLSMKPGITCLWQVNGRNKIDFDKWMRLDLEYIDNWSLALDLKIVGKTVPAVLLGKGAS